MNIGGLAIGFHWKFSFALGALLAASVARGSSLYVSTSGSDETGTGASDAPFKTIQHAYDAAQAAILGGESEMTVYLAAGTHYIKKTTGNTDVEFVVSDPVRFVGQGSSPGDVTVKLQYSFDWNGSFNGNVVTLDNAGAALVNLTVSDGFIFSWGAVSSLAAGVDIRHGMVSNCVVRSCTSRGNNCHVAGVFLGNSDAILSHTKVTGCRTYNTGINAEAWHWSKVGGVHMNAGRMENCVVENCKLDENASTAASAKYVGGVIASGGTIVNCTIVGNQGYHAGGMYAYSNARVYNTVFAGNSLYDNASGGENDHARIGNSGLYFNCASDTTTPICEDQNCVVGTAATFFTDFANADYTSPFGSPLIDAGANAYVNEETDMAGTARICGGHADIGAYESPAEILVNITTGVSGSGSVTITEGPYVAGENVTVTAVPDEGFRFVQWQGDVPAEYAETASFTFAPTRDVSLTAYFAVNGAIPIQYVSTAGSDENDGLTSDTPRKTIPTALAYLAENFGFGNVYIAPGTYSLSGTLIVTNDIAITGLGATPEDTIVRNGRTGGGQLRDWRVMAIDSAGAKVSNLTLADGATEDWGGLASVYRDIYGGCATLYAGVVSNCVIRNGGQYNWNAYAGGIYVGGADALLTHSVIRNCNGGEKDASWSASKGGGVWISAGRMENCLVKDCQVTDPNKTDGAGGIRVTGGRVVNCTVVGCSSYHTGGIYAGGGSVVNCVVANSSHRVEGESVVPWAGGSSRFVNCASDAETAINATCFVAPAESLFVGAASGDYTPCFGSPLTDNGAEVTLASTTDLAGTPRVKGDAIDIGAYEADTEIPIVVDIGTSPYGTTTGAGEHIAGRELTITATPVAGYEFYCWDGNIPEEYRMQASFTFIPAVNYTVYPRFVKTGTTADQYVSTSGSDENDGFSEENARATVQSAHDYLAETYGFGTIHVAAGTYRYPAVVKITSPVAIVGGGSPADVVFVNSRSRNDEYDARIVEMRSSGASISGVTLTGGAVTSWGDIGYLAGGCATVYAGMVSNCVVSAGRQNNWQTQCGGIGLVGLDAFMTHCVVTNCATTMADDNNWTVAKAGGVFIDGGRMENCLVVDCEVKDANPALSASAGGVRVVRGSVANCTVLYCRGNYAGGLNAAGGTVYNTVVFGCTKLGDGSVSPTSGSASRFVNCATDAATALNETCAAIDADAFTDVTTGRYTPRVRGALYNTGAKVELLSSTDLAGNARICGRGIDIGCYENVNSGFALMLR